MGRDLGNKGKDPCYGALQELVDSLFGPCDAHPMQQLSASEMRELGPQVRRLDVILASESLDLCDDLREVISLLPPGNYTRQRLCDQLNSALGGHGWGQVYGTVG